MRQFIFQSLKGHDSTALELPNLQRDLKVAVYKHFQINLMELEWICKEKW